MGDKRRLVQREGQPALHGAGNLESQVQELVASHQKLHEMQSQLLALATANATSQKQTQQQLNQLFKHLGVCLLYTSPSPRDGLLSRMPSSA